MDLRQLRTFLAVAQERHFGRAAERLHIAQPAVSQQIRTLEADVGTRLFDRTSRSVELTAAGRTLLAGAPDILDRVAQLGEATRATGRSLRGELRLNYARTSPVGIATDIVEEFRRRHPEVKLIIDTMTTTRSLEQLREGTLDAAFLRLPLADAQDLTVIEVGKDPLVAALPRRHRLARRREIAASDLHHERIVFWPRAQGPGFHDWVVEQVFEGCLPRTVHIEPDTEQMVRAVARGAGVAVTTRSRASLLAVGDVVFKPLASAVPASPLALAWRVADGSAPLRQLVTIARRLARSVRPPEIAARSGTAHRAK
ncbi:MAG: LysR family transcriptional regulator [Reyranella sp.]|nr:LysR family transcriptional regulator [Reyranella sp.]MBL6650554.1 LysR family transcriptional regulator [Reyranella sp.]